MSKNKKKATTPNMGSVSELPRRCPVCVDKAQRAGFCEEHFVWFKEGLINRKGEKPKDFDKKYAYFLRKQAA